jgi:hypothetical protein
VARAAQDRRVIQPETDEERLVIGALETELGHRPTVADAKDLQLEMVQVALRRMVELRIAGWLDAVLRTLRDDFQFDTEQLARFARAFRERTREQEQATAADAESA